MRPQALVLRLADLEVQEEILAKKIDSAKAEEQDKAIIGEMMLEYAGIKARQDEILQWQKSAEADPRYGTPVRVNGMWRPKLPEFGSIEKALEVMSAPNGTCPHTVDGVYAAREHLTVESATEAVRAMNGRSPLIPEDERRPFNTTL